MLKDKVYGPYLCSDNRRRVLVVKGDKRTTKLYARFLLEQKLGHELAYNEVADHKDDDFTNDNIDNLQVLSYSESNSKGIRAQKLVTFQCICGNIATKVKSQVERNKRLNKSGPYCSKKCAGYYSYPTVAKLAARDGLKIRFSKESVGSTPTSGTL